MNDLVTGNWVYFEGKQWKVKTATPKHLLLRLACWHRRHDHVPGQKIEIEEVEWTVTSIFKKSIHLRKAA